MTEIIIPQGEADHLLKIEKFSATGKNCDLPDTGGSIEYKFVCNDKEEEFVLNYTRSSIKLSKITHHLRMRKTIGLLRLDLDGPPHRNPDGKEIGPNHLHIYKEGYGLKYAMEIPRDIPDYFTNIENSYQTLLDFLTYCNVEESHQHYFSWRLFS